MGNGKRMPEDEFEALVQSLQEKSFQDVKDAFGEVGFERWINPKYNGPLPDADCHNMLTGKCGDTIQLFLKFKEGKVDDASYMTNGCASSMLSGSFTAEMAIGCTPERLFSLTPQDVVNKIGKIPDDDRHCADLAIEVLHECANKFLIATTENSAGK